MRYPDASLPPPGTNLFGASVRGPQVVPGTYQVRLTAGGTTQTQPFEIRKDPRTSTTAGGVRETVRAADRDSREAHRRRTTRSPTSSRRAPICAPPSPVPSARRRRRRLPRCGKTLDASLASVQDELVQMNIRDGNDVLTYPAKLNNLIAALAPVVAASDTAPTAQSYEVFKDLSMRLDRQLERLDGIMAREVAAFNQAAEEQHVAAIPTRPRRR